MRDDVDPQSQTEPYSNVFMLSHFAFSRGMIRCKSELFDSERFSIDLDVHLAADEQQTNEWTQNGKHTFT